jgi:MurNAc alpha-1-phosphate uridylyltransferase
MMFPVVILAGGLATRLYPISEHLPKSLIKIHGEPFIAHQLKLLQGQGIRQVVICVGYLGNVIESLIGDGSQFDLEICYAHDGKKPLGTAGAIKQALPLIGKEFFVLYGDSYLTCDYSDVQQYFLTQSKQALMTIFKNKNAGDESNVEYQAGEILQYDKTKRTASMEYIDYGLGVLTQSAFNSVPDNEHYDLAGLYQTLLDEKELAAYEAAHRFYEIGSFAGIKDFTQYLSRQKEEIVDGIY